MKLRLSLALTLPVTLLLLSTAVCIWASGYVMMTQMLDDILAVEQAGLVSKISDAIEGRIVRSARSVHMLLQIGASEGVLNTTDLLGAMRRQLWLRLQSYLGTVRSQSLSGMRLAFPDGHFIGYIAGGPQGISGGTSEWSLVVKLLGGVSDLVFYDVDENGAPVGPPFRKTANMDSKKLVWWAACSGVAPSSRSTTWADEYSSVGQLLAVIACQNVFDGAGANIGFAVTHFFVRELTSTMQALSTTQLEATSFVVDRSSALLIASSRGPVLSGAKRLSVSDPEVDPTVRYIAERLRRQYGSLANIPGSVTTIDAGGTMGQGYFVQALDVSTLPDGPRWIACSSIARSSFMPRATVTFGVTVGIALGLALVGALCTIALAQLIARPLHDLSFRMEGLGEVGAAEGLPLEKDGQGTVRSRSNSRPNALAGVPPAPAGSGAGPLRRAWRGLRALLARAWLPRLKFSELVEIENRFYQYIVRGLASHYQEARFNIKMRNNFIRNMSHEIRTPLNGIVGCATLLRDTGLSTDQKELADLISTASSALVDVISDILDWEKIKSGRMILVDEDFDLREIVEDSADVVIMNANARAVDVITRLGAGVPSRVRGDRVRLRQVLLNLLSNAVKFSKPGGTVTLQVSTAGQRAAYRPRRRSRGVHAQPVPPAPHPPPPPPHETGPPCPAGAVPPAEGAIRRAPIIPRILRLFPAREGSLRRGSRPPPAVQPEPAPAAEGEGGGTPDSSPPASLRRQSAPAVSLSLPPMEGPPHPPSVPGKAAAVAEPGGGGGDVCRLEFAIADEGIGIAPEQLQAIFLPFVQADATITRKYGGTGLGLALSSSIVQEMGGRIKVESTLGQGSRFHFVVPLRFAGTFLEPDPLVPPSAAPAGTEPSWDAVPVHIVAVGRQVVTDALEEAICSIRDPRIRFRVSAFRTVEEASESVGAWLAREGRAAPQTLAFVDGAAAEGAGVLTSPELPIPSPAPGLPRVPLAILAQRGRRPSASVAPSRSSTPINSHQASPASSFRRRPAPASASAAGSPLPRAAADSVELARPAVCLHRPFRAAEVEAVVRRMREGPAPLPPPLSPAPPQSLRHAPEQAKRLAAGSPAAVSQSAVSIGFGPPSRRASDAPEGGVGMAARLVPDDDPGVLAAAGGGASGPAPREPDAPPPASGRASAEPGAPPPDPAAATVVAVRGAPVRPPRAIGEANVLCAEDNPFNRLVLSKLLTKIGCRFAMAEDGRQAVDALLRAQPGPNPGPPPAGPPLGGQETPSPFHIVLMDVQMPVLDGIAATEEIRAHEASGALPPGPLPVIGVSANCTPEDRQAATEAGMQDFCAKPLKMENLVQKIMSTLGLS